MAALTGAGVGPGPVGLEFLDPEVVEAALSVLARKTRAELILGLLEDFVANRRSGRVVLADFRLAMGGLGAGSAPGAIPEWERLRQVGRAKGEPVVEWEIFHGLSTIATRPSPAPRRGESGLSVDTLENAMDLSSPGGLGEHWSLHAYLAEARAKLGPQVQPRDPEILGATLLHIDHARQLLKPGGLSFDLGVADPQRSDLHTIHPDTARQIFARQRESIGPRLAAAAGVEMLRRGVPGRAGPEQSNPDVDRALVAGEKIVAAQRAREKADQARTQATAVRGRRLSARGNALYLAGTVGAGSAATSALAAGLRADLSAMIGISAATVTLFARGLQDWEQSREPLIAPFRAWYTARRADRAERAAEHAIQALNEAPSHLGNPLRRSGLHR